MRRYAARGWERPPWAEPSARGRERASELDPRLDALRPDGDDRKGDQDALIVDVPQDVMSVPVRDRVTLIDVPRPKSAGRRRRLRDPLPANLLGVSAAGEIVEDRLDGQRIYPEPPRRARGVNRARRLAARSTPLMLPFAALAWIQACIVLADAWTEGGWSFESLALLALRLGYVGGLCLLPAAVLLWRPDGWRSAPLVFGGAVLWTTLPAMAGSIWWIALRSPELTERIGVGTAVVSAAAAVLASLGPIAMAAGLERTRRIRDGWFDYVALRMGAIAALVVLFNGGRWLQFDEGTGASTLGSGLNALRLAGAVAGAFEPMVFFGLAMLAFTGIAAFSTGETQTRLWQCVAAAGALLAGVSLYEVSAGDLIGSLISRGPDVLAGRGWYGVLAEAVMAAGGVAVFLGFSSPVWSGATDAEGSGRGAPDEIFAWGASKAATVADPLPMNPIVAVAAGADHALAVDVFGRVGAWGDDSMGQTDVPEDLVGVVSVAAGDGFSVALRGDGTVAAWGANDRGQANVPDNLSDVTAIAAGRTFGLALRADGTLVGWGDESSGVVPVPQGLLGVVAISAGDNHALALRLDGTVFAWGDDRYGQANVPLRLGRARSISAGGNFSVALLVDGTVAAWGDGSYGQLDVPSGLRNVVAVSAGAFHALALLAGGDLVGWGGGSRKTSEAAHPWHLVDFKAVAAGDGFSLAIRAA